MRPGSTRPRRPCRSRAARPTPRPGRARRTRRRPSPGAPPRPSGRPATAGRSPSRAGARSGRTRG
ncbi:hypothetical protein FXF51_08130 [Nonomuraea sp. PA05]|nr:hypothetical protein FXF51_08130 [Nonomuraea sp. PA05]